MSVISHFPKEERGHPSQKLGCPLTQCHLQSTSTWLGLLLAQPLRSEALEDVDEQLVEALGRSELHALVRGVDIGERRAHGDGV